MLYLFAIHLAQRREVLSESAAAELLAPIFPIPSQIESIFAAERQIENQGLKKLRALA